MKQYPNEVKLGLAALIVFALWSGADLFKKEHKFDPRLVGRDNITLYVRRFEGLREILPSHGTVGYISDRPIKDYVTDRVDVIAGYYLAQYAIAPVTIDNSIEHELVIGNFHQPDAKQKIIEEGEFKLLKDFGNGVVLFKRTESD